MVFAIENVNSKLTSDSRRVKITVPTQQGHAIEAISDLGNDAIDEWRFVPWFQIHQR